MHDIYIVTSEFQYRYFTIYMKKLLVNLKMHGELKNAW
ncbi:hypothetical protein GJA_2867 [Janthinobacterium agaricidamnosum NBRC 102515 = DSM 9628]|uniref:Uncharacterized protein n=1 Tax=Janthinobacterium agaricidamnosum NBRC 102515 = DSM 9628 TaxID=1349767 RepID=W0V6J8_9BURK|nr:hypothetical protein GJA_2867 [Janthinobacterium agaricidamnosum NBRC 102515 = DSM 9628]